MSVSFTHIPSGNNLRVPLFYAEMDNSQANYGTESVRSLLLGQKLAAGAATANIPVLVTSQIQANTLFGQASMLARMYSAYRQNNPAGEVWCLPVAEAGGGTAQAGTITVTGPATAAGTINLYIAGQKVAVSVGSSDSANTVATAINAAINAATDLPVTSTVLNAVVTWTCRWKGVTGGDITVTDSFYGYAGGETLPTGIALAYAKTTSGATNPTLTTAITGMGDEPYDFIIHPFTDATSMAAIATELNDTAGRWSYSRQVFGHSYTVLRDTASNLVTAGGSLADNQHATVLGIEADVLTPVWEMAAAYGAVNHWAIAADPARPVQGLALAGVVAARAGYRFIHSERNSLLDYRIATQYTSNGVLYLERMITTYKNNALSVRDYSYFDSETLHQSAYILRTLKSRITSKYGRHKVANDGTIFGAGQAIVTPSIIKGELIAVYQGLMSLGLVEDIDAFIENTTVERDLTNPNRVNVLFAPDYINQLRIFAVLNQFRLQY